LRRAVLRRLPQEGDLPVDDNLVKNLPRPIAPGLRNWLFAGSLRAAKRAAAVKSLIQAAL